MRSAVLLVVATLVACDAEVTEFPDGAGGTAVGTGGNGAGQGGAGTAGGTSAVGGAAVGGAPGTGGGSGECTVADGDYGDCDLALGWAFDGEDCVPYAGCDCTPDCGLFTSDLKGCIDGCGYCDADAFKGEGIADDGWGEGAGCDRLYTCVKSDVVPVLQEVVPSVDCASTLGACSGNRQACDFGGSVSVTAALFADLCNATLIEDVDEIVCLVLGP